MDDLFELCFKFHLTERELDLYLQRRVHRRRRRRMLSVRRWEVQDEQWERGVCRLCCGDVVGCDRRKCVHILRRGRCVTSGEHGVRGVRV